MCVCLYVKCVHVCMCICVYVCIRVCVYVCICVYACMCICVYMRMCVCMWEALMKHHGGEMNDCVEDLLSGLWGLWGGVGHV